MNFLKNLIILLLLIFAASECGATEIICNYNFGNKTIVENVPKGTTTVYKKYTKDGLFYEYKIANINKFNEIDDYISIANSKGHRITYSLECFKK